VSLGLALRANIGWKPMPVRAFTLVEIIVVIIILGVMAGLILPHAIGTSARQVDVEARAAQHLLSIAAERDTLSVEPQALEYDDATSELRLLVRRIGSASAAVQGESGEGADAWRADPLLLPAVFTSGRLTQAWADGRPLPRGRWRVMFTQDQVRPAIVLQVEPRAGAASGAKATAWQVALPAEASAATRVAVSPGQAFAAAGESRSIDLDASGKGEKPW
jgi:prepilin-type N-terminal cleavage/methylation domain-containing protein